MEAGGRVKVYGCELGDSLVYYVSTEEEETYQRIMRYLNLISSEQTRSPNALQLAVQTFHPQGPLHRYRCLLALFRVFGCEQWMSSMPWNQTRSSHRFARA